jgi:hypothetical protein
MSAQNEFHYDAFISYRHNEFDSFIAENLHKKLENFKLPKSVLSKVKSGKTKIERVFRDVDELPLTDNLSDPISKALLNSDFLITICTPRYLESRWCMKEIEVFLQTHPRDHILVVLAEDEPVNSFPEILCFDEVKTPGENGETVITRRQIEPLAADTRGENKKEILKAMDNAVIKLCAAIFGLNYDDLKQRHREQRIRRLTMIFGSIGAAILAFAIFATIMLIKISNQNRQLQYDLATTMTNVSQDLIADGRIKDAVYAVRGVLPDNDRKAYNENALKALYTNLDVYKVTNYYSPVCTYDADIWVMNFDVSNGGKNILLNQGNKAYVYDVVTGDKLYDIPADYTNGMETALCSGGVLWSTHLGSHFFSFETGENSDAEFTSDAEIFNNDDGSLVIMNDEGWLKGLDGSGNLKFRTDLSPIFSDDAFWLIGAEFHEKEIRCHFTTDDAWYCLFIDPEDGQIIDFLDGVHESFNYPEFGYDESRLYTALTNNLETATVTEVTAISTTTKEEIWKLSLDDFEASNSKIRISDEYLFLCGDYEVAVIEKKTGNLTARYSFNDYIIEAWQEEEHLRFISSEGRVYECTAQYGQLEITKSFFKSAPDQNVTAAEYVNGDLYCQFKNASYITRYSNNISALFSVQEGEYERTTVERLWPDQVFGDEDLYDFSTDLVDNIAFYSDDGKYSFGLFTDHTAKIFDAKTGKPVISFETTDEHFNDFRYSSLTGSYILSGEKSIIFDRDMRIICETDRIICEDGTDFIMENPELGYCRVPYIDYSSLCRMADDYLGDYTPPATVKQKYGLN